MSTSIEGLAKAEAATGKPSLHGFRLLSSLSLTRDEYDLPYPSYTLTLTVDTEHRSSNLRLRLRFTKVSNLKLGELGSGHIQIIGLNIIDISDRQWESFRFEVEDYEDQRIHFFCWNAEVLDVTPLD